MAREIVSAQFQHNGGTARVEQDHTGQHVTCSGCGTDTPAGGMAPALSNLVTNHGDQSSPRDN
ncbi:hypothetical protein [Streptantibioticus silvisoli]|uniref:Uncharacterized protein n=1 Tax=Streptantibioticus silvisoli TaxID=2705255 RepID=A0ABT6W7U5_9ACTN|nr:hypothetical protein [Streptantibioticus silvisoli]MDI5965748.1 hypothetical protein [Streptantibioticus silvisoli]